MRLAALRSLPHMVLRIIEHFRICLFLYLKIILKKLFFYFKLFLYIYLDYFDLLISKTIFKK
jgi:hypothetical protein